MSTSPLASRRAFAALLPLALALAPAARAQEEILSIEGQQFGAQLGGGAGIAALGDVNDDGVPDFAVGERLWDGKAGADCGRVTLFSGKSRKELRAWEGEYAGDELGAIVRNVRDIDGDQLDDLAIVSPAWPKATWQGKVEIWSGKRGTLLFTFTGEVPGDRLEQVCGVGDVTGDGINDLVTSAIGWNKAPNGRGTGRVYLHSGKDGAHWRSYDGRAPGAEFGWRLAALDFDSDKDGLNDFVATSLESGMTPPEGGRIEYYSANWPYWLAGRISQTPGDELAYVTDAADVDGDGDGDLLFVAPKFQGHGGAWLYSSYIFSPLLLSWTGTAELPIDGGATHAGDVNGDGFLDLAFPFPSFDRPAATDVGMVQIVSGVHGRELTRLVGTTPGGGFGSGGLVNGGDLDRDKKRLPDLLVGTPGHDTASSFDVGRVQAFSGNDLYLTLSHEVAYVNDTVDVATTGGVPGNPVVTAVISIDGFPTWIQLLAIVPFDPFGELIVHPLIAPDWVPFDLELQSFAIGANGKLVSSSVRQLALR